MAAMAASTAFPPIVNISSPAAAPIGWLATTMPRDATAGSLYVPNVVPARSRQPSIESPLVAAQR